MGVCPTRLDDFGRSGIGLQLRVQRQHLQCSIRWSSLTDRMRSSDIQEELKVEPELLLRWFRHLIRLPGQHLVGVRVLGTSIWKETLGQT